MKTYRRSATVRHAAKLARTAVAQASEPAVSQVSKPAERCRCLDVIRTKLHIHHGAEIDLELKQTINTETLSLGTDMPPLYYTYTLGRKRKRSYVTFNFCPFCGKRIP